MNASYDLRGCVFMVTGAGSGIGAATAELLAACGAKTLLVSRNLEKLQKVIAGFTHAQNAEAIQADVSDEQQMEALLNDIGKRYGHLDGAFNNAGIFGEFGMLENDRADNFGAVMGTNVKGVWACMKHQLRLMKDSGGSIVNCSSVAGHQGHAMSPIYSASKHAIIGLSKSASLQYASAGVRVNVLSPGSTDTPILRSVYQDEKTFQQRASRAPMGRVGTPGEIAQAAVWLLSGASSYVNGQTLLVDGGVMAGNSPTKPQDNQKPAEQNFKNKESCNVAQ